MRPTADYGDPALAKRLFCENYGLAVHLAVKYPKRFPRADLRELEQAALIGLHTAARKHKPNIPSPRGGFIPFGPYALRSIIWNLQGCVRRRSANVVSLDAEAGDESSAMDVFESRCAQRDERDRIPDDHQEALFFDVRHAIATLPTLTKMERRILQLRFIEGLADEVIQKRLKRSYVTVSLASSAGIRKLREHFAGRGALAPGTKIQHAPIGGWAKKGA